MAACLMLPAASFASTINVSHANPIKTVVGASSLSTCPSFLKISTSKKGRSALICRCDVAVQLGGAASSEHHVVEAGKQVRVTVDLVVYHVPKFPDLNLKGMQGTVKEVLGEWKGKPVSANLPYKVAFEIEKGGVTSKFIAHVKDGEYEML